MHRGGRVDLVSHVLVESDTEPKGVAVRDALIADPYVERGEGRRRLFPGKSTISAIYIEQDPKGADGHQWRAFFEKAGAQGTLRVGTAETHADRYERERVAEFLGLAPDGIGESNNDGYILRDYDVQPNLPEQDASEEIRAAVAAWLEDGFSSLRGKGHRTVSYFYHSRYAQRGSRSSIWVSKLAELAWVPCDDDRLRIPQDVLPRPDQAREGLPESKLSPDLLLALEREGLKFGSAIPEAPALRRLVALGSQLSAEDLAQLLREVFENVATDDDARHFERAVANLPVPSSDGRRIPVDRIVQRAGGPLRGTLGGWTLPLAEVHEELRAELEHSNFPFDFPETTTGAQALAYIRDVWSRAQTSPERLANEVRAVLPIAYAYCLGDAANDEFLSRHWDEAVRKAAVFAEREWVVVSREEGGLCFDDIEDRRFLPSEAEARTATSGHLGNSAVQQLRTARALGLTPLSETVEIEWQEKGTSSVGDWFGKFQLICRLLHWVRGKTQLEALDEIGAEPKAELMLRRVEEFELKVSVAGAPTERVPVSARLNAGFLIVAGPPVRFASDGAKELLRGFSFRQRGDLAADLTGMLAAIDDALEFALAVDRFVRSFALGFDVPIEFRVNRGAEQTDGDDSRNEDTTKDDYSKDLVGQDEDGSEPNAAAGDRSPSAIGGSYDRRRALAAEKALAEKLRKVLKGEIDLGIEDGEPDTSTDSDADVGGGLGDEIYREVAARYERLFGREPSLGDPHQTGWDLRSIDPENGSERMIEVKGKGRPWTDDEVVELSRAQVRKGFEVLADQKLGRWYLYVVERTEDGAFQVLPVENPASLAGKWILRGAAWRMVAEDPRRVTLEPAPADDAEE